MLQVVQDYRLDALAFAMALVCVAGVTHLWLRRRHRSGLKWTAWGVGALLLAATFVLPEALARQERRQLREMIAGIAPTYARELELAGHARLTLNTPADDPDYLRMVAAQIRWEQANRNAADIYTLRRGEDGQLVFLVDSETDYDRNGRYEGAREQRTEIGEPYEETTENMLRTFDGSPQFDDVPETDRWGTWVSAYAPLRDADGNVEAIVGVDYDAYAWLTAIARARAAALGLVTVVAIAALACVVVVSVTRAELERRERAEKQREQLQEQLVAASRQAGMAEVATSVLHNVGNVLNSVNVSAGLVTEKLQQRKVGALSKAVAMLHDHRRDLGAFLSADDRGKLLPDYLAKLAQVLSAEQESMLGELSALCRSVEHIKRIIASQQEFAKCAEEIETFDVAQAFEDAIRMNATSLERHGIEVVRRFGAAGTVTADRHKVLQILVNLISNARNAVATSPAPRRIELCLERSGTGADGTGAVRLCVRDNGLGIRREDLPCIFRHGFTTRKDGHGFGLHSAAIAARQMKGSLSAASDGPGCGATFVLDLPVAAPDGQAPDRQARDRQAPDGQPREEQRREGQHS